MIKEISYSPFGRVVRDTSPNMKLPVGFRGGVVVANNPSSLLFMTEEKKFYDADIGQWFCPGRPSLYYSKNSHKRLQLGNFDSHFLDQWACYALCRCELKLYFIILKFYRLA